MTGHVPDGVPSLLKVGEVSRVLNVSERRVKVWLERGALAHIQPTGRSGARLVTAEALAAFASHCGLPVDWGAVVLV
ncbi:helix-turn-helix domain-containing protein [Deinococcus marmoris]|uniref:Helix-turn-helix domain-containing protein n=1 Tax=Deinococcus marmoris TaxID=249408 RepID=A0A1U7NX52_9DEIO|nr:helix-turn-helix domain-containing protein [Deinococcus marmoris]OLV17486.1 hypothetical protein BOO71_0008671 [Deinococcus marmoris]